jgi:hypothetical protein
MGSARANMSPGFGRTSAWMDALAIGSSIACLIHCLMLPLLFAALPAASRMFGLPESFHLAAFLFAVPASAIAMASGFRHHGAVLPAAVGAIGLVLIGVGALAGFELWLETGITVAGSLLLAFAHLKNWRLRARSIRSGARQSNVVSSHDSSGDSRCV